MISVRVLKEQVSLSGVVQSQFEGILHEATPKKRVKCEARQTYPCLLNMRNTCLDLEGFFTQLFRGLRDAAFEWSIGPGNLLHQMGKKFQLCGRGLHTQTSPSDTNEGLSLAEYPAITCPSMSCGRGDRGA